MHCSRYCIRQLAHKSIHFLCVVSVCSGGNEGSSAETVCVHKRADNSNWGYRTKLARLSFAVVSTRRDVTHGAHNPESIVRLDFQSKTSLIAAPKAKNLERPKEMLLRRTLQLGTKVRHVNPKLKNLVWNDVFFFFFLNFRFLNYFRSKISNSRACGNTRTFKLGCSCVLAPMLITLQSCAFGK